jgi:hypothetical protein
VDYLPLIDVTDAIQKDSFGIYLQRSAVDESGVVVIVTAKRKPSKSERRKYEACVYLGDWTNNDHENNTRVSSRSPPREMRKTQCGVDESSQAVKCERA